MFNFLRRQSAIGIDISDYSIEILQLNKKKEVLAFARVILEEGIVQDGKILDKEKLVAKLKQILENAKPNKLISYKLQAILSLPESKIFIGDFKIIPWRPEEVYTDKINNLQIAASKEIVDEYVEVMCSLEIKVIVVDVESLSLSRALMPTSYKLQATSSVMIIDIGARTTNLSIFSGGVLKNSITVPIAGNDFTKAIADYTETRKHGNTETQGRDLLEEAERLKKKFGFSPDSYVLSILQASFQPIIKEIKKAIKYYENNKGEKIEEIILAGGSALIPKIDEYLAVNLERKVGVGNPLAQISARSRSFFGGKNNQSLDKKYFPILFANVIGLALRGVGNVSEGINLLPREHKNKKTKKTKIVLLSFCFTILALSFVIYQYFYMLSIQKNQTEEYLNEPSAPEEIKVESPEIEETVPMSPENELLPKEEGSIIEVKEIIILDTPTGWLNVREGPGASYGKITQVKPGETYSFLEENDKWYKIKINEETEGWVVLQYAEKQ